MFDLKLSAVAFSRRAVLKLAASAAVAGLLVSMLPGSAIAQRQKGPAEVPVEELMKPGVLADVSLGPADAKVTVVEYASLTCPHCAHFTNQVFPEFRKKYVDTGKVHYIFRGFALNPLDQAAQMLVQCLGGEKRLSMIEAFFAKQTDWAATSGNPVPKLFDLAKQAGFTQESFDKCLTDQKLLDEITAGRTRAGEVFGVSATPTFFINGKKLDGAPTMEKFDAMIEPLLAKS